MEKLEARIKKWIKFSAYAEEIGQYGHRPYGTVFIEDPDREVKSRDAEKMKTGQWTVWYGQGDRTVRSSEDFQTEKMEFLEVEEMKTGQSTGRYGPRDRTVRSSLEMKKKMEMRLEIETGQYGLEETGQYGPIVRSLVSQGTFGQRLVLGW